MGTLNILWDDPRVVDWLLVRCPEPPVASVGGGGSVTVAQLMVPLAGVLVAAAIAAWVKFKSDALGRKAESQRTSLYELQEKAHDYRILLGRDSEAISLRDPAATERFDSVSSAFSVAVSRCRASAVRVAAERWLTEAEAYWLHAEESAFADELRLWTSLQDLIGRQLRRYDA